jgi:peptidoglycan/LPS O-acetylase OafA/YrhL
MLALVLLEGMGANPDLPRFLAVGGPAFLLVASAALLSRAGWDTEAAWVVLTGDASYILYLIHPYCEFFLARVLGKHVHWFDIASGPGMLITVSLVVLVAIAIHLKMERPTIAFLNRRFGGRRKSAEFAPTAPHVPEGTLPSRSMSDG